MNRKHKFKNIESANILAEQRYLESKGLDEGWGRNLAAGLAATAGSMGAANAQAPAPTQAPTTHQVQSQLDQKFGDVANPFNAGDNQINTPPIVGIQTGVTDGRTGKSGVYVYHNRLPSDPNFNPKTDREIVYTENLPNLRKTAEYREYMAKKGQNANVDNKSIAMNEAKKAIVRDFHKIFESIKRQGDDIID